jgi:hypothetical protein
VTSRRSTDDTYGLRTNKNVSDFVRRPVEVASNQLWIVLSPSIGDRQVPQVGPIQVGYVTIARMFRVRKGAI